MKKKILIATSFILLFLLGGFAVGYAWFINVATQSNNVIADVEGIDDTLVEVELYAGYDFDYNGILDPVTDNLGNTVSDTTLSSYTEKTLLELQYQLLSSDNINQFSNLSIGNVISFCIKVENNNKYPISIETQFKGILKSSSIMYSVKSISINTFTTKCFEEVLRRDEAYSASSINNRFVRDYNLYELSNNEAFTSKIPLEVNSTALIKYQIEILSSNKVREFYNNYYYSYYNSFFNNYLYDSLYESGLINNLNVMERLLNLMNYADLSNNSITEYTTNISSNKDIFDSKIDTLSNELISEGLITSQSNLNLALIGMKNIKLEDIEENRSFIIDNLKLIELASQFEFEIDKLIVRVDHISS